MTEPRTTGDPGDEPTTGEPATPDQPAPPAPDAVSGADSPTQAWPSLAPSSAAAPSAASWASPSSLKDAQPAAPSPEPAAPSPEPEATSGPPPASEPFEPADRLAEARLGTVDEVGMLGATATATAPPPSRSRSRLRWGLAVLGILIVLGATALIVYLAGGRPAATNGLGYMPAATVQYSEIRLDLPGDQRQKLAAFLANLPGFKDQTQIEPKLFEVFDRIVRAATSDKQSYTADIEPWFGGQIAVGAGIPDMASAGNPTGVLGAGMSGANNSLVVISVKDRARAEAWLASIAPSAMSRGTYNGAAIWTAGADAFATAVAVTDKVMLAGSVDGVHAAIDSKGQGGLAADADFKAAFAQVDRDYVALSLVKTRPYIDAAVKAISLARPGVLEGTQLDETIVAMIPAWQVSMGRFENDAFVTTTAHPSLAIGQDATNRKSTLLDHVPAQTLAYAESHDVGPALTALLGKFRALPEAKAAFQSFDQAMSILGGSDAVLGWWGDMALVVTPGPDGVIGAGLVIQPRDKAAADRFFTTVKGFVALAGGSSGLNVRDEDHNGTQITIIDFSAAPGMTPGSLPPGYKAEVAYAVSNDIVVLGYGRDFVAGVLDAGPGTSLAGDDRFKKLLARVGEENMGLSFLDVNATRALIEPLIKQTAPAEAWAGYQTEILPYLEHVDALISSARKDGALDRGQAALTVR